MSTDIESRLRTADPAGGPTLHVDSEAMLQQILLTPGYRPEADSQALSVPADKDQPRRRLSTRWMSAAAAVAALLTVGLVVGILGVGQTRAVAGVVPALVATPTGEDKSEVLDVLLAKSRAAVDPAGYHPSAASTLSLHETVLPDDATFEGRAAFSPLVEYSSNVVRNADGTFTATVTHHGIVSAVHGERLPAIDPDAPGGRRAPGSTTVDVISPGQLTHAESVPRTAGGIDEFTRKASAEGLAQFTGNPDAALFEVLGYYIHAWNPSQAQSTAVLELIRDRANVTFDGRTKDRMGRPGLMFSVHGGYRPSELSDDRYSYRYSFIFDPETGHLNAYEQVAGQDIDYFRAGGTLHSVTKAPPKQAD